MAAYNLIGTTTVGSGGAASIVFSGIPQTFTDLHFVASIRSNAGFTSDEFYLQFNGLTTNLSYRTLIGVTNSGTASSNTSSAGYFNGDSATASVFGNLGIYIPNYTSSNYKSFSSNTINETNGTTTRPSLVAGLWSNTAAITSCTIVSTGASTILQYSSASLYGIKNS
jgi:hypothetical protein